MSSRCVVLLLMPLVISMAAMPAIAQDDQVPRLLNYQGHLVVDGQPISGTQQITFALYDRANGGSPLEGWQEERTVAVENGVFSVLLGEQNDIPTSVFENRGSVYLSIAIDGSEFRVPLTSTPFSFRAAFADRAAEADVADDAAVRSLNDLTSAVEIVAGSNVSVTTNEQERTIEISAEGGGNGGLTSVNTDETLTGDGTAGSELGIASGATVRSLNGQTDGVSLIAGQNVSIDEDNGSITISAQAGGNGQGAGVHSLNDLTGEVTIRGGRQIEIDVDDQDIIIHRVGGGGSSSLRYKENVEPLLDALSTVEQLQGVEFTWKEDRRADIGLIAEDVENVLPQVVHYTDRGETVEGINYDSMVALLVEAIKEQQNIITGLESRLERQEDLLQELTRLVENLQDAYRN